MTSRAARPERPAHPLARPSGLALLGALTGLTPLAIDAYLPALPGVAADLDAPATSVQLTLTALLVGLALGQVLVGPISDAVGRRRPVLVGLVVFTAASMLCAVAPSVEALVLLRVLQGAAGAAAVVCARAVVRDLFEGAEAARAFARLVLVMGAAPVLAPLLGAQVLRVTDWRGVFFVVAAAGGLMLVWAALLLRESLPPERRRPGGLGPTVRTFGRLLRDRPFTLHALAGGFGFAALFAYIAGSSFVLQELHGLSEQEFAVAFGVNAACFVVVSQVGARVVRRTGARRLLVVGGLLQCAGAAVVVGAVAAGAGLAGLLPGLLLVVAAVGLTAPNATALALADHGSVAGAASALLGLLQYCVAGAAAPLAGLGAGATGMAAVIAVCAVGGLVCALLAHPRRDTRAAAADLPAA